MFLALVVTLLSPAQGQAPPDPILFAVRALAQDRFRTVDMNELGRLFPPAEAEHLASGGAPRVTFWRSNSHPCRISFHAGQAIWGSQVVYMNIECSAKYRAEAVALITPYVKAASPLLLSRFERSVAEQNRTGSRETSATLKPSESGFAAELGVGVTLKPEAKAGLTVSFNPDSRFADR